MELQDRSVFVPGCRVQHFRRETADLTENPMMYLYEIVGIAEDTETGGELMVYRALYGSGKLYARPLEMFLSPVDRDKYPDIHQTWRFMPADPSI
ncbi:MAG: DUF1653 domain-containing protein [Clostridia bacterium]|nr:DUF1653 domain-containing protein [Clostridia bacterium]